MSNSKRHANDVTTVAGHTYMSPDLLRKRRKDCSWFKHTAEIKTHNGWWFRYVVHRAAGIGIPENSTSLHRTLKGARRAAKRWCDKQDDGALVDEVGRCAQVATAIPTRDGLERSC